MDAVQIIIIGARIAAFAGARAVEYVIGLAPDEHLALCVVDIFNASGAAVVDLGARQMLVGVIAVGGCEARGLSGVRPESHARRLTVSAAGVGVGRIRRILIDAATSEPVVSARRRGEQAGGVVAVGDGGNAFCSESHTKPALSLSKGSHQNDLRNGKRPT